jgi:hypothetical protein
MYRIVLVSYATNRGEISCLCYRRVFTSVYNKLKGNIYNTTEASPLLANDKTPTNTQENRIQVLPT